MPFGYGSSKNYSPSPSSNTNARENARSTQYSSQPKTKSTFKTAKTSFNDGVGKSNLDNAKVAKVPIGVPGSTILNALQNARQKLLEKNKKFFREKVLTSKNRGGYKDTLESYSSYMKSRLAGTTDAYGNTLSKGNDNKPAPSIITKNIGGSTIQTTAPTEAEVSQSEAANADAAALKVKKRGRSASILTGPKGVTKMASNYSLGKKSLLGRV